MKIFPLLILFCCQFFASIAQRDSLNQEFLRDKSGRVYIELYPKAKPNNDPPYFSHFEVVDFRADTEYDLYPSGGFPVYAHHCKKDLVL